MDSQVLEERPRILVVEDDIDNLLYISHALIFFRHSFATAQYAQPALYLAKKHLPSLILLDIRLPERSGLDLVGDLKHDRLTKNIPIVAISALEETKIRKLALAVGCDDFLRKPYLLEDLERKINFYLALEVAS